MVPLLPLESPRVVPEEKGTQKRKAPQPLPDGQSWTGLPEEAGMLASPLDLGEDAAPIPTYPAWLLREMVGASLPGGSNAFLGRLQKYPIRERSLPRSRSCPQPGPPAGPGVERRVSLCVCGCVCPVLPV